MSYEVTATRRRPQHFEDLVGQEFVAETLKNSISTGKIAHAYLFSGPRGCGKTSTARILAKALNCANGPTATPCGQCSNCQEITKGSSLDVIEIDGASNTSVDNIRQIKEEVMFPPSNCRYKIYIIDEVHMLSNSAFNALLKTIEEPPAHVIFIFATTELQKVPATIKSRCQQFNFRLVAVEKVKQCLAEAAAELGIQADDEALFWVARESTGSMRDAYTLFDQVVAFSDGHITYDKIRDKLGLVGLDRLNAIFEACSSGKTDAVLNILDEFLQGGISIEQLISNCADYLRSLLLIKSGVTKEALLGNSPDRYSQAVLSAWNPIQIERALSIYLQLYRDIRYSLSPRYELELAFSRLCWISQYVSNVEVKKAIDAAQTLLMGGNAGNNSIPVPVANQLPSQTVRQAVEVSNLVFQGQGTQSTQPQQVQSFSSPVNPTQHETSMQEGGFGQQQNQTMKVPAGLPRLSMLDSMEESEPGTDMGTPEGITQGDASNPFYDGGSLPPDQTVMADDDDWSNTATPPDDDYYDSQDYSAQAEEVYEQYSESEQPAEQNDFQSTTAQINDSFVTGDGRTISVAQLRGNITATLSVENGFIVSALERTGEWKVEGDTVETTVASALDHSILQKNIQVLNESLTHVCGKKMVFSVKLHEQTETTASVKREVPSQVSMLVDIFKGTLL